MNFRRVARGWLFWLALILPIAQAMAGVHALSHVGDGSDEAIVHLVDCDLCLTAAHLAGVAPAAAPKPLLASPAVHAAPEAAPAATPGVTRLGLPPARAPPVSV
ncbi:hypothetical protein [Roseateles asaccharophilus]|uniref:DUF2946 domain-containing protein n=1 Tax=Roseateles asaccharophilus TaxID=582607 RepID=A0ABU2A748_9BURK|nr:hypothetical protein [Roseateles asaccharophilus]MDR7333034.1 hypothetical protein [Roseateles asaccharophilus]